MSPEDITEILGVCRLLYPFNYNRWIVAHPRRIVVFKMLERYPEELFPIIKRIFEQSEEYRAARSEIGTLSEDVIR